MEKNREEEEMEGQEEERGGRRKEERARDSRVESDVGEVRSQ